MRRKLLISSAVLTILATIAMTAARCSACPGSRPADVAWRQTWTARLALRGRDSGAAGVQLRPASPSHLTVARDVPNTPVMPLNGATSASSMQLRLRFATGASSPAPAARPASGFALRSVPGASKEERSRHHRRVGPVDRSDDAERPAADQAACGQSAGPWERPKLQGVPSPDHTPDKRPRSRGPEAVLFAIPARKASQAASCFNWAAAPQRRHEQSASCAHPYGGDRQDGVSLLLPPLAGRQKRRPS